MLGCLVILALTPQTAVGEAANPIGVTEGCTVAALTHSFKGRIFGDPELSEVLLST